MLDGFRLWFYNNLRRHWHNYLFRRRYYAAWISEGKDPALFPKAGKISRQALEWARQVSSQLRG